MFRCYFDIRDQDHGKCALCKEITESYPFVVLQRFRNASAGECDQPGTAAYLAGWGMEAGVWGDGGVILHSSRSKRLPVFPW